MFPVLQFLKSCLCPDYPKCERTPCPFSHEASKVSPTLAQHAQPVVSTNDNILVTPSTHSSSATESSGATAVKRPAPNPMTGSMPANKQSRIDNQSSGNSSTPLPLKSALKSSVTNPPPNQLQKQHQKQKQVSSSTTINNALVNLANQISGDSPQNRNPSFSTAPQRINNTSNNNINLNSFASSSSIPSNTLASRSFQPVITNTGPPQLNINPLKSHTDAKTRQSVVSLYYKEFMKIYARINQAHRLASEHALAQEQNVYDEAKGKVGYRNASAHALSRLRHRVPTQSESEAGTNEQLTQRKEEQERAMRAKMTLSKISKYIMSVEDLVKYDYVVEVPPGEGGDKVTEEGCEVKCTRCQTFYIVKAHLSESEQVACKFHPGKVIPGKSDSGIKIRTYSCCHMPPEASFCAEGAHVFQDKDVGKLHSRVGFITSDLLSESKSPTTTTKNPTPKIPVLKQEGKQHQTIASIVALDCELVFTTSGLSLARVTLLDETGTTLIDELVRPIAPVIDILTAFSGIKPGQLDDTEDLVDIYTIRKIMSMFIGPDTVIIGHGLENDLKALRIVHKRVIDTAFLYPHRLGLPFRNSLKLLTREHLKLFIQDGPATQGHDSKTDALMALNLVRHKMCKQNETEGTSKNNSVKKEITNDIPSAIVK